MFLLKGLINMITNLKRLAQAGVILSALVISSQVHATLISTGVDSVLLDVDNSGTTPILMGARNIDVFGTGVLWDVIFDDRSFDDIFGDDTGLDTTSSDIAILFSQALLDYVFVNIDGSNFDDEPTVTNSCSYLPLCRAITPYTTALAVGVATGYNAMNFALLEGEDQVGQVNVDRTRPTSTSAARVYANWSASQIPEPAPLSMLLTGLCGLLIWRRFKKRV
jgi:hypothetical protein